MITSVRRLLLAYVDDNAKHSPTSESVDSQTNDIVVMESIIISKTKVSGTTAHKRPRPTVTVSVFMELGTEVHEQMYRSGGQSDVNILSV
ncbi:hypothetical protein TNCV_1613861 [Trichonephila clavipes]|nr:hypothetical protein TNCV_1613861 [Trichonephila clavipes]